MHYHTLENGSVGRQGLPTCRLAGGSAGYALVVSLVLLILLALVTLGFLSLGTVTVRTATSEQGKAQAQANARLALMLALGELQKSLGDDRRVSAPSTIFDSDPETAAPDGLAHPHLTGVWNARNATTETLDAYNKSSPDYSRDQSFRRWLVSNAHSDELENLNFPKTGSLADPVTLVNLTGGEVSAGKIPVSGGTYAWWVGDENCKARVNTRDLLAREENPSTADLLAAYATPAAYGMKALSGFEDFPANSETSDKLITRGQLGIDPPDSTNPASFFHDLTAHSESVLADVTKGTLRKDLSIYLERDDIDWLSPWRTEDWNKAPLGPNEKIALSPLSEFDVLSWKYLHHFYNLQRQVRYVNGRPTVDAIYSRGDLDPISNPHWNSGVTSISPVVVRMQYLLSYGARKNGNDYTLFVYSYPVATLWNPYNVDMSVKGLNIFLHNMPIEHTFFLNKDKVATHKWTKDQSGSLVMRIGVTEGGPESEFILKAGEQKIFNYDSFVPANSGQRAKFFDHYMTSEEKPWHVGHAGRPRGVAGGTIKDANGDDRIEIRTVAGVYESTGRVFANFETSFEVRTEPRGDHLEEHSRRMKQQLFSSIYAWRFERSSPRSNQLSESNLPSKSLDELVDAPTPFCLVEVSMKPLDELQTPNKTWLNAIPSLSYMGATSTNLHGTDPITPFYANPYTVTFDQRTIVTGLFERVPYMGTSYTPSGQRFVADREVPQVPLNSLAQLQNLPLVSMESRFWGTAFQQNHAIGNSYASPGVPSDKIKIPGWTNFLTPYVNTQGGGVDGRIFGATKWVNDKWNPEEAQHIDRSYCANHLLWDEYFFSSMAPQTSDFYDRFGETRNQSEVISDFLEGTKALPNAAYRPYLGGQKAEKIKKSLIDDSGHATPEGHLKSAAHLMASGGFNVNSTSIPAWTALLASSHLKRPVIMDSEGSGNPSAEPKGNFVVSRFTMPIGGSAGAGSSDEENRWRGYRELTADEISQLAEAIVKQVKTRGPFRSLAEFVNRRLADENDETALYGALQAALEDPKVSINEDYHDPEQLITVEDLNRPERKTNYAFKKAALGSRFQGTPAYIAQADILQPIAPIINARSDTFLIRGYGEALAADGKTVIATARCEAVVQRYPDYLNPLDSAETPVTSADLQPVNQTFGRRFSVVSFRWLTTEEI